MIIYTPLPLEMVLEQETAVPQLQEVLYQGTKFLVEPGERGQGKIHRILSTDPLLFLRPEYQPGKEIPIA